NDKISKIPSPTVAATSFKSCGNDEVTIPASRQEQHIGKLPHASKSILQKVSKGNGRSVDASLPRPQRRGHFQQRVAAGLAGMAGAPGAADQRETAQHDQPGASQVPAG